MPRGGSRPGSGPKKRYETRLMLKLSQEMLDAIDSIILEDETRSDVIRRALGHEVKRCLKIHARAGGRTAARL